MAIILELTKSFSMHLGNYLEIELTKLPHSIMQTGQEEFYHPHWCNIDQLYHNLRSNLSKVSVECRMSWMFCQFAGQDNYGVLTKSVELPMNLLFRVFHCKPRPILTLSKIDTKLQ